MLDLLAQLLPIAGAGAQGYMQGSDLALQHQQMKQIMAMKEAEEMRAKTMFPIQHQAAQVGLQSAEGDLAYNQRLRGEVSPELQEFMGRAGKGVTEDQYWQGLGHFTREKLGYIGRMPRPTDPNKYKSDLFNIYSRVSKGLDPMDAVLAATPEIRASFESFRGDQQRLMQWLESELKMLGVNVGPAQGAGGGRLTNKLGDIPPYQP